MLSAFKRIPELFPFPMAKRAYCKQYAVVLLPIFAYVKSDEGGRKEQFFSRFLVVGSVRPTVPLTRVMDKLWCVPASASGSSIPAFRLSLARRGEGKSVGKQPFQARSNI